MGEALTPKFWYASKLEKTCKITNNLQAKPAAAQRTISVLC